MNITNTKVRRVRAGAVASLAVSVALMGGSALGHCAEIASASALGSAAAAAAWQDQEEQPQVLTRVYSLRPLVDEARSNAPVAGAIDVFELQMTPPASGHGRGQGGASGTPTATNVIVSGDPAEGAVKLVIDLILNTIDTETWQDNGGTLGHITYFPVNNRLVVTNKQSVHAQVAELLGALQDRRVVSVQARLVQLDEAEVARNTQMQGGIAVWQGDPTGLASIAQARYSGFDGRTQVVSDGRQLSYIAGVTPIVAANSVGYQTTMSKLNTGLTLRVTPAISDDGSQATLEVSAEYVLAPDGVGAAAQSGSFNLRVKPVMGGDRQLTLDVVREAESGDTPTTLPAMTLPAMTLTDLPILHKLMAAPDVAVPDRLNVQRQALETSLRIPTGQWVLIGSLGASDDGAAAEEAPIHLLLRLDAGEARE